MKYGSVLLLFVIVTSLTAAVAEDDGGSQPTAATQRTDFLGDPLPPQALLRFGTLRFQHARGPTQIILSDDEQAVVSLMWQTLFGWDAKTGRELWSKQLNVENHGIHVGSASYGIRPLSKVPGSSLIAYVEGNSVNAVDAATGETTTLLNDLDVVGKALDISADGQLFAVGGSSRLQVLAADGTSLFNVENDPDEPLGPRSGTRDRLKFGGDFSYGRFSPDGKLLAVVNSEKPKTIQLLRAMTGELIREVPTAGRVVRMDFSPDSSRIVATERDIAVRLYDVSGGNRLWEQVLPQAGRSESYTSCVAFRPDGQEIAVGAPLGSDFRIRLLNPQDGAETGSLKGCTWKPWTITYTHDSSTLFGSGWDGTIRQWEISQQQLLPPPGGLRATAACAMSHSRDQLVFTDDAGRIHLVSLPSGETEFQLSRQDTRWDQFVFSGDGTQLAAAGHTLQEICVVVWDLATREVRHDWSWPKGRDSHSKIEALAWSRNGRRIAAASFRQDAAYVWDLNTDAQIAQFEHQRPYGLDIDAEGKRVITGGWDKHIREWNCDTGACLNDIDLGDANNGAGVFGRGGDTRLYGVKYSHDGELIAAVDMEQSIRLFDRQLKPRRVIPDVGSFTFGALQFSNNDQWLAVGTGSGAAVYDVNTGAQLWGAQGHRTYIYTVDFGPDDRTLLSGGSEGVCYLWSLEDPTTDAPLSIATYCRQLTGKDASRAFEAELQLTRTPEATVSQLVTQLTNPELINIPDSEYRRALLSLAARSDERREQSQRQFRAWGLSGYERLLQTAESQPLGGPKQQFADLLKWELSVGYARAARLLARIDSEEARAAIRRIQAETPSTLIRSLIEAVESGDPHLRQYSQQNAPPQKTPNAPVVPLVFP